MRIIMGIVTQSAIIGMAQNFVGSNNINLLILFGQFGKAVMGCHDSASSRYTTALNKIVDLLLLRFELLDYTDDDGIKVELPLCSNSTNGSY